MPQAKYEAQAKYASHEAQANYEAQTNYGAQAKYEALANCEALRFALEQPTRNEAKRASARSARVNGQEYGTSTGRRSYGTDG